MFRLKLRIFAGKEKIIVHHGIQIHKERQARKTEDGQRQERPDLRGQYLKKSGDDQEEMRDGHSALIVWCEDGPVNLFILSLWNLKQVGMVSGICPGEFRSR